MDIEASNAVTFRVRSGEGKAVEFDHLHGVLREDLVNALLSKRSTLDPRLRSFHCASISTRKHSGDDVGSEGRRRGNSILPGGLKPPNLGALRNVISESSFAIAGPAGYRA